MSFFTCCVKKNSVCHSGYAEFYPAHAGKFPAYAGFCAGYAGFVCRICRIFMQDLFFCLLQFYASSCDRNKTFIHHQTNNIIGYKQNFHTSSNKQHQILLQTKFSYIIKPTTHNGLLNMPTS